jgi:large subunit ribosomal protein L9
MAHKQEVLLVQDVLKLGNMGDLVKVAPGYARNYLFTHALAIPASAAAKRQIEVLREKAAKSEAEREVVAQKLAKTMQGMTLQIAARVAHDIELFGALGTKEIVQALAKSGITIDGKQVHLTDRLRKLGVYQIEVRLHKKVSVTVKLEVVNSDPNAPSLADALAAYEASRKAKKVEAPAEGAADAEAPKADAKDAKADAKSDKKGASKGDKGEKAEKSEKAAKKQKG